MDSVHILMGPVSGTGPRRGSMDQGSMFCTCTFSKYSDNNSPSQVYVKIMYTTRQQDAKFSAYLLSFAVKTPFYLRRKQYFHQLLVYGTKRESRAPTALKKITM